MSPVKSPFGELTNIANSPIREAKTLLTPSKHFCLGSVGITPIDEDEWSIPRGTLSSPFLRPLQELVVTPPRWPSAADLLAPSEFESPYSPRSDCDHSDDRFFKGNYELPVGKGNGGKKAANGGGKCEKKAAIANGRQARNAGAKPNGKATGKATGKPNGKATRQVVKRQQREARSANRKLKKQLCAKARGAKRARQEGDLGPITTTQSPLPSIDAASIDAPQAAAAGFKEAGTPAKKADSSAVIIGTTIETAPSSPVVDVFRSLEADFGKATEAAEGTAVPALKKKASRFSRLESRSAKLVAKVTTSLFSNKKKKAETVERPDFSSTPFEPAPAVEKKKKLATITKAVLAKVTACVKAPAVVDDVFISDAATPALALKKEKVSALLAVSVARKLRTVASASKAAATAAAGKIAAAPAAACKKIRSGARKAGRKASAGTKATVATIRAAARATPSACKTAAIKFALGSEVIAVEIAANLFCVEWVTLKASRLAAPGTKLATFFKVALSLPLHAPTASPSPAPALPVVAAIEEPTATVVVGTASARKGAAYRKALAPLLKLRRSSSA